MSKPKIYDVITTGTTEPRDIRDRFSDTINVKDFGAVGDGVTDDTATIQAAVDYAISIASASSPISIGGYGVAVRFPAGSYKVTTSITINHHGIGIVGDEGKGTQITGDCILFDVGDYTNTRRIRYTSFKNLNLQCSNTAGTTAAIKLYRTTTTKFEEVNFVSWQIGIDCYRASTTMIDKCWATNALRTAQATAWIRMQGTDETLTTGETYTPGGGIHITDCEMVGASTVGSYDTDAGILLMSCDGFYMAQTHFTGCVITLDINPDATAANHIIADVMCINCYFDEPSTLGGTTRNMLIRGTVKESITMASGAVQSSTYQSVRMSNCYFRGATVVDNCVAIRVADGDSWWDNGTKQFRDLVFSNCTFRQSTKALFQGFGATSLNIEPYGLVIDGCSFEHGNSSASIEIGAAINVQVESCVITNNTFNANSGTSYYTVFVSATDAGNDFPNPAALVHGNDFSKTTNTIEAARITQASTGVGQMTLLADNIYPGAGRVVRQQYKLTTTDAEPNDIWSFVIPAAVAGFCRVTVSGSKSDGTKSVAYTFEAGFRNNGVVSSLSSSASNFTSVRAWNPDAIATVPTATLVSNTLKVTVTGVTAETWTWSCLIEMSACK